ncbi:hypothetical protein KP509_33G051300 [Ceratopteris richardii]|uniref:Uncharacterized protein n=1 Tax=Ceratopteris richardii TaxID=49495 RepID=A0A8T2QR14_CERRI|nr:hypothetical protein KP509_33G051300 [Ceratopteris richardii]
MSKQHQPYLYQDRRRCGHRTHLLTWRGMQGWCLGRRASGLCRFFIRIRRRPRLRLSFLIPVATAMDHGRHHHGHRHLARCSSRRWAFFVDWLAYMKRSRQRSACMCLPVPRPKEETSNGGQNQAAAEAVLHISPHIEAQVKFKRVGAAESGLTQALQPPSITQLGSSETHILSCLNGGGIESLEESSSSLSATSSLTHSASASSSTSSGGGFRRSSASSKLREACSRVVDAGSSSPMRHLVSGNQLLLHLSAAPLASMPFRSSSDIQSHGDAESNPSASIVKSSSIRHKDSDLKDRIIFFL